MSEEFISVGKVSGVFGVKGWIKVFSYTEYRENILAYSPWTLRKGNQTKQVVVLEGRIHSKTIVAYLKGIDSRDLAAELNGWEIIIDPEQLPKARKGEYYWRDLIGLKVKTTDDVDFGVIQQMLETGANDVVVALLDEKERLIPFLQGETIVEIDLTAGTMIVDWDPDF